LLSTYSKVNSTISSSLDLAANIAFLSLDIYNSGGKVYKEMTRSHFIHVAYNLRKFLDKRNIIALQEILFFINIYAVFTCCVIIFDIFFEILIHLTNFVVLRFYNNLKPQFNKINLVGLKKIVILH
jgi:hypothetical protein